MARAWDEQGTIYFLKLEPRDGFVLPYYKMGFTTEDVHERITKGLQTGNPFKIVSHHEIKSEFAGGLETYLHKTYRKYMVGQDDPKWDREWFKFDSIEQLDEAYRDAVGTNEEYKDIAVKLRELKTTPSNGQYVELPDHCKELLEGWKALHEQEQRSSRLLQRENLRLKISGHLGKLIQAGPSDGTDVSGLPRTPTPKPFRSTEDWKATAEQYPQVWEDCYETKIEFTKRPVIKGEYKPSLGKVSELTDDDKKLNQINRDMFKADFDATGYKEYILSQDQLNESTESRFVRERHIGHVEIEKSFIEVQLQVMLGENDGFFVMCESDAQKELASKPSAPTRTVGGDVALDVFSWPRTQVYDSKATQREFKRLYGSKIVWTTPDEPTPASEESLPE